MNNPNDKPFGFHNFLKKMAEECEQSQQCAGGECESFAVIRVEVDELHRPLKVHASWGTFVRHSTVRKDDHCLYDDRHIEFIPNNSDGIGCVFSGETLPQLIAEFELATTLLNWSTIGG